MRINWLGIIISAILMVALRYLWYAHFAGAGWGQLVNALVLSLGIGWIVGLSGRSVATGLGVGLGAGILFGLTAVAEGYIHGAPLKDFMVDGGYALVAYTIGGLVIGAFAPKRSSRSKFNWGGEAAAEH